jgi:hypothetical protein
MKKYFLTLSFLFYGLAVTMVATCYQGSIIKYFIFSFAAALMLYLGLVRRLGYGAPTLSIFLWLGLWLKLSVNMYFDRPYTEATGDFLYSPVQYDELMNVGTLVCLAVATAWCISNRWITFESKNKFIYEANHDRIFSQERLWSSMVFAIILLNLTNVVLGIVQSGLPTQTILHWPLNALVSWFIYTGLAFMVAAILHWEYLRGNNLVAGLLVILFEGATSGVTTISRGLYLWHVLPIFMVAWSNCKIYSNILSKRILILISILAVLGFLVVGTAVNVFRNSLYDVSKIGVSGESIYTTKFDVILESSGRMMALVVDRWVGAEGIMVAVGYPDKGIPIFKELLLERPSIGHVTKYQFIAKSHYSHMDANKYQFNTLPGVAGFLYLSGSLSVVFIGVILLSLFVSLSEYLIYIASENSFVCAMSGVWMANMVAQMGVTPSQLLPQLAMNFACVMAICLVQKYWFRRVVC